MAKAKFNPLIPYIRGKIGGIVFRRCHTGEIVASKRLKRHIASIITRMDKHRRTRTSVTMVGLDALYTVSTLDIIGHPNEKVSRRK